MSLEIATDVVWVVGVVLLVFTFVGVLVNVSVEYEDDQDCPRPEGPHDEPPSGCREYCENRPVWYGLGSKKECWWDDK